MEQLEYIESLCKKYGIKSLRGSLDIIRQLQAQNIPLDVAVYGQFKAGKSSFLNHLFERPVLPVGVTPVTAIITRIRYAPEERAIVRLSDGTEVNIALTEIENYVSEKHNPQNVRRVACLDIYLPTLTKMTGLRFIDTPGLGSVFEHNTVVTQNWYEKSAIALVLIAANAPLSAGDIELIRAVRKSTPEIHILLTKADLFTAEQLTELESFLAQSLASVDLSHIPIHLYSIHSTAPDYRAMIRDTLLAPIIVARESKLTEIVEFKKRQLIESTRQYFTLAYEASKRSETEKAELLTKILDEQNQLSFLNEELSLLINSHKAQARLQIEKLLLPHLPAIQQTVLQTFETEYPSWRGHLMKRSQRYEAWAKDTLTERMTELSLREMEGLSAIVEKTKNHAIRFAHHFRARINDNIKKILGLELPVAELTMTLQPLKNPDVSISWAFDIQINQLWFLFPNFLFGRLYKRHFRNKIPDEVEKNIQRLISDYTGAIQAEMAAIQGATYAFIRDEIATIKNLLSGETLSGSAVYREILQKLRTTER